MKHAQFAILFLLGFGIFAELSHAITIEPDNYPDQTVLSDVYPGVTLSVAISTNEIVDIWSVTADIDDQGYAPTGRKVFGHNQIYFWNTDRRIRIDFVEGASSISLIAGGTDHLDYMCQGILEVYGIGFDLLDVYQTAPLLGYQAETMSITRPTNDIYFAIAYTTGDNPFGRLDGMELVIPEPATFFLLGLGLFLSRKRK